MQAAELPAVEITHNVPTHVRGVSQLDAVRNDR
jgi:hypothetical protein